MRITTANPKTQAKLDAASGGGETIRHIVGGTQALLADLRLKTPRAMCGELMREDPDRPGVRPDSPLCAECRRLNGGSDGRGPFVPPRRAWK